MGRLLACLVGALVLAGCSVFARPVALLTGDLSCYLGGESGPTATLVADDQYGTTFDGRPVVWPDGYTAHWSGSEVVILDRGGQLRATTGRVYHISFAHLAGVIPGELDQPFAAAVECGYAWDFIDCTAQPDNGYCRPD